MNNVKSDNSVKLRRKISAFIDSDGGFLEMIELKQFLNDLSYDSVTIQEIEEISNEFEGINSTVDFLLLKYLVEQNLFYESKTDE